MLTAPLLPANWDRFLVEGEGPTIIFHQPPADSVDRLADAPRGKAHYFSIKPYIKRKRSWSRSGEPTQTTSKADTHQRKVLLSVWWDYKGIVYFELFQPNRINSDVYIEQLTKLNNAVKKKRLDWANRKSIVFHHDNASRGTSLVTW